MKIAIIGGGDEESKRAAYISSRINPVYFEIRDSIFGPSLFIIMKCKDIIRHTGLR